MNEWVGGREGGKGTGRPLFVTTSRLGSRRLKRSQGKAADADKNKGCAHVTMPEVLAKQVVETCMRWPGGRVGDLEGVVRLMAGGRKRRWIQQSKHGL